MWVDVRNNIFITRNVGNMVGFSVQDAQKYEGSRFYHNIFYNLKTQAPRLNISYDNYTPHPLIWDDSYIREIINKKAFIEPVNGEFSLDNLSDFSPKSIHEVKN